MTLLYPFYKNNEYVGQPITAEIDQFSGLPLVPAFCTIKPIPAAQAGKTRVFNRVTDAWEFVADNRGHVFDKLTGDEITHGELGTLPNTLTKIPKPAGFYKWSGSAWVFDLDAAIAKKVSELTAAFNTAAVAGFVTSISIKMDSSIDSIQMLKSAYDLAGLVGLSAMPMVVDFNNIAHANLPMADVLTMIIELGVNYQTIYAKKQTLRGLALAATTQSQLDAVIW